MIIRLNRTCPRDPGKAGSSFRLLSVLLSMVMIPLHAHGQLADALLERLFEKIDTDADRYLSRDEYLSYYETAVAPRINQLHADQGPEALEKIHSENRERFIEGPLGVGDLDGDGQLSFDEYKAYNDTLMNE